jgi:hypothetical protein
VPPLSVLPEIALRGALEIDLEGLSRPITICAPAAQLDPEPCVTANQITVASPLVALDRDGALHFVDDLPAAQVAHLARTVDKVVLPISVAGRRLLEPELALAFERPRDLDLVATPGEPDMQIRVERGPHGRLVDTVHARDRNYLVAVEAADAPNFHIISRGADGRSGFDGSDGIDGLNGMSGSSASCSSSGSDGSPGGDGSSGSDGSDGGGGDPGGNIQVDIACGGAPCTDLVALVGRTISSVGGSGGSGGRGGRGGKGGRGGSGGSGTTCTTDNSTVSVSGGRDGLPGRDGSSGRDGFRGSSGAPGRVSVRVVP